MGENDGNWIRSLVPIQKDNGVPTQVDIASLEGAVPWLEGLKKYMQDHLLQDLAKMKLSKNTGDLYFGGVDSAGAIYGKHNQYVTAVLETYRDVIRALDVAADATGSIVKNYKNAEHNNALNVAAVEKAFSNDSGGGGSTVPTSGNTSGATQGGFAV
jgi:hypothetical protein